MADPNRRAGIFYAKVDGNIQDAKGEFTVRPDVVKREALTNSYGTIGYMEEPQTPYIEGAITDRGTLDTKALYNTTDATITIEFANGKVFVLRNAWYAGDATTKTKEAEINFRFEGLSGEEI